MRGEFGQWLGSMFMRGSSVRKFWFEEKPLEARVALAWAIVCLGWSGSPTIIAIQET
jgi:hypothetical protein